MDTLSVFCADVGSVQRGNFGWAAKRNGSPDHGQSLEGLADAVAQDLGSALKVSLGFECPMFVPLRSDPIDLTKRRTGETNPNWIGGPGSTVLATGIVQVHWTLHALADSLKTTPPVFLDWLEFFRAPVGLFLWEAFVSGAAKGTSHVADARIGLNAFLRALPDPERSNAITDERVISLVGVALLHSGWLKDLNVLHKRCLVIKA